MPAQDEPYQPLAEYRSWYAQVEQCAGRTGDYSRLRFWVLDLSSKYGGYTQGRDIWIQRAYQDERLIVEHEMLHSLGFHGHGDPTWKRCGLYPLTYARLVAEP
jgi:hypothetical protein